MKPTGISVVIPNYNGTSLLNEILPCAEKALLTVGLPNEIIVVDDCSTDESISFLKNNFPRVKIIQNEINSGFSPTINKGIFSATFDHILLLNNDVKLNADYFIHQLKYFDNDDCFGVMGRIIGWDDDRIQDGGKYPVFHGAKIKTNGNFIPHAVNSNEVYYSMYLSGANAFVSKEKLIKLGGFDEIFAPFYVEDFELSLRAWRLGWKCYYEHHAVCRHKLSVTIKSKNKKNTINRFYYRNKMFLHAIHLQGFNLFSWYLQLIPELMIRLFTGRFYFISALFDFVSSRHQIKKSIFNFNKLATKEGNKFTVKQVVSLIRNSLAEKNITRF